jgi:hypothetical protein
MVKYKKLIDSEDIKLGEIDSLHDSLGGIKHRIRCCDCGAVHDLLFYADGNNLRMSAIKNNRATAQIRRRMFVQNVYLFLRKE